MLFNYLGEDLRSRRPNQAARKKPIETYFHLPYLTRLAFVARSSEGQIIRGTGAVRTNPLLSLSLRFGSNLSTMLTKVLGRILLREGDIAGAKQELAGSAGTTGTPVERSFGPNMLLARELQEAGEREAVLAFLEKVRVFWSPGAARIDAWEAAIRNKQIPDFDTPIN